ncbi:FAD-dependent oxidoreductase [Patescibacteria group bacterium]|nr:FAD-dependent oxidoreductase [Patescibacteria group bacterium]MBU1034417.1 FAD-dependent oxidoreductase [Patescibacteria group bacterium]
MKEAAKYLIIGGGIAGTTAAETIRQQDKDGSIAIISDEPYGLYSRIMLSKPNFFLEKIPFEKVWLKQTSWYQEQNIKLIAGKKAVELDVSKKTVVLDDGTNIEYEKLLLAIGGCARKLTNPGSDKKNIFVLRTLDDAKGIIAATKTAKKAVTIGGGFVSFEMCDMLRMAGIEVTLLIREDCYWKNLLDETSGAMIEDALIKGGVKIIKQAEVAEFYGKEKVEGVVLKDGSKIDCDMAICGVGIFCPFSWLESAGIKAGRGILANEFLETNIPDIWTAGDSAEFKDIIIGETVQLGNWVNAQMQGKAAGLNMVGKKEPFKLVSFYTTQGFGLTIAFVGDIRPKPERVIINRGSKEMNSYARIIIADGEVVGATLINRTQELSVISKIIEKDINVAGKEKELSDPAFNLSSLN